jgi:hypothetical protein
VEGIAVTGNDEVALEYLLLFLHYWHGVTRSVKIKDGAF